MSKGAYSSSTPHRFPPTPANSSPPAASTRSQSRPPPPESLPPSSKADPHRACRKVLEFLERRAQEGNTGEERCLRIEDPCEQLLFSLRRARRQASGEDDEEGDEEERGAEETDGCASNLFADIPARVFRTLRLRHIATATPPVLVIRPMVSALHNCISRFVFQSLLAPPPRNLHGFCQAGLLTDAELADLVVEFASPVDVPGGPVEKGYNDASAPALDGAARKKARAVTKEPDVAFFYSPGLAERTQRRTRAQLDDGNTDSDSDTGTDSESDDDGSRSSSSDDASDTNSHQDVARTEEDDDDDAILVYPSIIMEIGFAESYDDLLADCRDYLLSSRGGVRLAIIVKIAHSPVLHSPTSNLPIALGLPRAAAAAAATTTPPASSPPSSPPTSPDSGPGDYHAVARQVAREPRRPLDVFIELWEWVEADSEMRMRGERLQVLEGGRIPARSKMRLPSSPGAMNQNHHHHHHDHHHHHHHHRKRKRATKTPTARILPIALRREDFGLAAAGVVDSGGGAAQPQAPQPPPGPLVMVDFAAYAEILQQASKRMEFSKRVGERKKRRAAARVRTGDVGGEWRPRDGDDDDDDDDDD